MRNGCSRQFFEKELVARCLVCDAAILWGTELRLDSILFCGVCVGGSYLGEGACSVPGSQCRGNRWCFRESQGWKVVTHHPVSKGHWAKCPQGEVVRAFHVEWRWNLNGRHWEHCFVGMESWKATLSRRGSQLSVFGLWVGHIQGCSGEIKCFCLFLSCVRSRARVHVSEQKGCG